jgi:DNA-binding NarL/FixJ family response regulator
MDLRVVVLAGEPSLVDRLSAEIDTLPGCRVVAGGTPDDDVLHGLPADVAVWDLGADLSAARDQISRIGERDLAILALGPISLSAEVLAAGAAGCLRRETAGARLRAALEAVALGVQVTEPAAPAEADLRGPEPEELTPRETEVLQLLVEGLPNKEIARRLGISEHTVKFHVTTVLGKMGARTRTEAVTRAIRQGVIAL